MPFTFDIHRLETFIVLFKHVFITLVCYVSLDYPLELMVIKYVRTNLLVMAIVRMQMKCN